MIMCHLEVHFTKFFTSILVLCHYLTHNKGLPMVNA